MGIVRYRVTLIIERDEEEGDDEEECEPEEAVDAADVTFNQYGFDVLSSEIEPIVVDPPAQDEKVAMTRDRAYGTCDGCGCPILPDAVGSLRNHCASCIDTDPMMKQLRREAAEAGEDLDVEVAKLEEEVRRGREIHDGEPR